jgi:hypothetical protein
MGKDAKLPIEGICDLFDGECQVYQTFGVERVVQLRYASSAGGGTTLDVVLSRFARPEGAYGMFTKRVVGDGDPTDPATPKPIDGGGAAVLGAGNAYLWRGSHLVELTVNDSAASPDTLIALAAKELPALVRSIGDALPGERSAPVDIEALPRAARVPMGLRYAPDEAFSFASAFGGAAFGYYDEAGVRYRLVRSTRPDEAAAKRSLEALRAQPGSAAVAGLGDEAVRLTRTEGTLTWDLVVARKGALLAGVMDEPRAMTAAMAPEARAKQSLPADAKSKRVEALLTASR